MILKLFSNVDYLSLYNTSDKIVFVKIRANGYNVPSRIADLISNLNELNSAKADSTLEVDLKAEFITPFSILPLAAYAYENNIKIACSENNYNVLNYLNAICFPGGVNELDADLASFLPIMRVPSDGGKILRVYEDKIISQVNEDQKVSGLRNSLKYLTGELQTNIKEHSKVDQYWMLAQYYARNKTCEIVLADCGIGYKGSYKNTPYEVDTDIEAINNALGGKSSKPSKQRGTGIRSIVNLFINYYGGKLVIMSGNSIVFYKQNEKKEIPLGSYWKGSLVAINFELKSIESDEFYKYVDI